jgi:L,D-transpeptidase catalytic domain
MRSILVAFTALTLFAAGPFSVRAAQAHIAITVDKDAQVLTVAVDGVERYRWPVSTGNPSHETPNGSFRTFRMEADHFSKEFDDAPMPHAIFFTKLGHAIHGTDSESKLGIPVSHGCVRLSRANAATLYDMVEKDGVLNTTVTLTGSAQVALARMPRGRALAAARGTPAPDAQYSAAGDPTSQAPQPRQYAPQYQQQVQQQPMDDGYIYPADGSSDVARYPAPPGTARRMYNAQTYPQQQQQYDNRGYAPQYQQQQPQYQPRGFFQ